MKGRRHSRWVSLLPSPEFFKGSQPPPVIGRPGQSNDQYQGSSE